MTIRIGINGFGRIGKTVLRLASLDPKIQVVKINDLLPPEELAHLLKYDSVAGTFKAEVEHFEKGIRVNGVSIPCSAQGDFKQTNWQEAGAEIVLECTGRLKDRASCEHHLDQGCKRVIISAPFKECDFTMVMGVNEKQFDPKKHRIISNASCTTNCLGPVVKVIDDHLGLKRGFMTTIHSYTNDQRLLDGGHKDLRRARAGALNQIPTTTGGAKAIGLVLPHLKGKLDGLAIRVPTPNVSLVDLVAEIGRKTTIEELNGFFQTQANGALKGILGYSSEPLVSSDFNGATYSAVVDGLSTNVMEGTFLKVLAWYDNENGFSQRMLDVVKFVI